MPDAQPHPLPTGRPVSDLTVAFHSFNESSQRLETAYRRLQDRLRRLDRELVGTNERLERKVDELNSLTEYLNELLARMHNGVVAIDAEGRVTAFNQAAERVLGLRAADVLGRPHERALRHAAAAPTLLSATLRTGRGCRDVEREVPGPGGAALRLRSSVAPIRDSRGQLVGAVEIFSDLTELRQLEERLARADTLAAIGQMTAQVAHEIRTPLNGIEGFASLLVGDLGPGDPCRGFASKILEGARRLNRIVSNMLLFCQPCRLSVRPTSARAAIEEALAFVEEERRHLGLPPLEVDRQLDPDADLVAADPDQLRQVLMNLLLNAAQAMGEHGRLAVATRRAGRQAEIRIADTGPGIPEAVREKVCEPFFTTRSTGTGLGLAIVQKIIRLHGGQFALEGTPGRGTTAVIALPRPGETAGARREPPEEDAIGTRRSAFASAPPPLPGLTAGRTHGH